VANKTDQISRRSFLEALGVSAGSSAMLRASTAMGLAAITTGCGGGGGSDANASPAPQTPPPPPSGGGGNSASPVPSDWPANAGANKSVIILGAGIAGMTCAFEMNKLGYTCTILEATNRAGGRNRTIRAGDQIEEIDSNQICNFDAEDNLYFNPGPARLPHHHEFILGYCREFGVELEVFTNDNKAALLHSTTAFGGQPQVARSMVTDTRGRITELLANAVNQNQLDQQFSDSDKANIIAMLRQYGDLDTQLNYTGSSRSGFEGQQDAGNPDRENLLSPKQLIELVNSNFWQSRQEFSQSINQQGTLLQPVGGMDNIAKAFEARVVNTITYEAVVTQIRKATNGVNVFYQEAAAVETSASADYCICTIPAPALATIPNDFSSAHQNAIQNFQYSQSGKLAFQSRRFWEQDHNIYGGISWTDQEITQIWYPNNGYGQDQGVIVGAYTFGSSAGESFAGQSPEQRISSGTSQGTQVHSEYANEVNRGISVSWPKVPFQLGAWGVSDPGVLVNADDNIYFAGEHLSILQGWQEGAVLSAYHAINGIVVNDTA
jgi:monoamine oxidase